MVRRGDGGRRGRACRRRPRRRTSTSTTGRCRRGSADGRAAARWPRRPGAAGAGSIAYLPGERGRRPRPRRRGLPDPSSAQASGLPVIIQGLGGRNKVDAPTATWEAAQAFLDRATEAGAPVYSMLITRPFDRPVVVDETNLHYLAVPSWDRMLKLPHAERVRAAARPGRARRAARRGRALQPRSARRAPRCRRRCGTRVFVDRGAPSPSTQKFQVAVDRRHRRRARRRAGRRDARPRARRRPRHRVPLAHREPGVDRRGRRGAARPAHDHRHLRRRRAPRPRRRRRLELVLPAHVGARPQGVDARGGHPPDHPGARRAASGCTTGARSRPARWADMMIFDPETIGPWTQGVRPRSARRRRPVQGVGRGRAGDDRERRADRRRRRAHRRAPRARRQTLVDGARAMTTGRIPVPRPEELRDDVGALLPLIAPPGRETGANDGRARPSARPAGAVPRLGGGAGAARRAVAPRPRAAGAPGGVELPVRVRVG